MDTDLILQTRSTLRRVQAQDGLDSDGFQLLVQIEALAAEAERSVND